MLKRLSSCRFDEAGAVHIAGGVRATLVIGGVAGLYPAIRAAGPAPTEALGAP
jgi:hypothetical protein